ncbi:MAG: dihydrofolate reductase family protein [Gemmatimonadales bacterium]
MDQARPIVVFDRVTVDGYFSDPNGGLDWAVPDAELDAEGASRTGGTGAMLFGRRTYEMFAGFWPGALDESGTAANPHAAGERSAGMRAIAQWLTRTPKYVFTRTLQQAGWANTHLLHRLDPTEIRAMKQKTGGGIIIFGSGSIVTQLTEFGLIDEYHLVVNPVLLGGGRSLVSGLPHRVSLKLLEAKPYASGNVMLRYAKA